MNPRGFVDRNSPYRPGTWHIHLVLGPKLFGKETLMSIRRKTDHATGWSAVGALAAIAITQSLSALLASFPLSWLASKIFCQGVALHALLGSDRLSYWRCVGLFAIWFTARIRIKFSGPAQIEIEGKQ